ncbi:ABC transporter permease [Arthrobacter castelli]|uniref:ABC transporter permease n=1 Tax=Arthrobacter castelli TaxID=271431 RepID=UPI000404A4B7|nr:ABC transporter permease [Arthrobacter castelli]
MSPWEQLRAALAVEWLKFRNSRPVWVSCIFLVLGVTGMSVLTLGAIAGSNPLLAAKAQAIAGPGGWAGLFAAANTIVSVGGLLGFGVVAGWSFGREFTDRTIAGLSARPVSRVAVAAAKLVILTVWPVFVAALLVPVLLAAGVLLGMGGINAVVLAMAGKAAVITVLSGLLALPCAWAAILGRGYLAAIGTIIAIVLAAQMAVMAGAGGWFPFSTPGLWAARMDAGVGPVMTVQLLLVLPLAALAAVLTLRSWQRLDLSR